MMYQIKNKGGASESQQAFKAYGDLTEMQTVFQ